MKKFFALFTLLFISQTHSNLETRFIKLLSHIAHSLDPKHRNGKTVSFFMKDPSDKGLKWLRGYILEFLLVSPVKK